MNETPIEREAEKRYRILEARSLEGMEEQVYELQKQNPEWQPAGPAQIVLQGIEGRNFKERVLVYQTMFRHITSLVVRNSKRSDKKFR